MKLVSYKSEGKSKQNQREKEERLLRKYNISTIGGGTFREGFIAGLRCAEKHYKKSSIREDKK